MSPMNYLRGGSADARRLPCPQMYVYDWNGFRVAKRSKRQLQMFRGGGWCDDADNCRLTNRDYDDPDFPHGYLGFRVIKRKS